MFFRLLNERTRPRKTSKYDLHRATTCWTIRPEPPSETPAVSIRSPPSAHRFQCTSDANSTHGVRQRFPSIDITLGVHSWTSRRSSFGALPTKPRARSALVVPPDSDGLLLPRLRRSVAPCSRSWGSLCFNPRVYDSRSYATVAGSPLQRVPFEAFPSQIAATRHRVPLPSRRHVRHTFRHHLSMAPAVTSITRPQGFAPVAKPPRTLHRCQ